MFRRMDLEIQLLGISMEEKYCHRNLYFPCAFFPYVLHDRLIQSQ